MRPIKVSPIQRKYSLPEACQAAPSLEDWLQAEDPDTTCKPCVLPVALQWYVETLDENGLAEMARGLETSAKSPTIDPLTLAQELDTIKARVDPNLRNRLRELDCTLQVNAAGISKEIGEEEHG